MNHSYWTIIVSVIDHSEIVKLSGHQLNSNLTSITLVYAIKMPSYPDAPWCWNIYLQNWAILLGV